MDYIPLSQEISQVHGIIYNSNRPIGGVRYYQAEKRVTNTEDENGKSKTIVYIKTNPEPIHRIKMLRDNAKTEDLNSAALEEETLSLISSKLKDIPNEIKPKLKAELLPTIQEEYQEQELIAIQKQIDAETIENSPRAELNETIEEKKTINYASGYDDYIVSIAGAAINFSRIGVEQAPINNQDREWLAKAQHYFIKAKEDGRAIGSAETYTTMDILEALWATAYTVGVDPKRFIVQIYNESRFNPYVEGAAGERGIGQFKEATAKMCGYSWDMMTAGVEGFAYQARASAEFVKRVGEIAYNGSGDKALEYQDRIALRLEAILDL